jgi:hypothetical protein
MNQLLEHHVVPAISALLQTSSATVSSKDLESEEKIDQEVTCRKMVIAMKSITLKVAESIADKVIHTAVKNNYAPITVVVLDSWGHTVVSKRMDGCAPVGMLDVLHCNV